MATILGVAVLVLSVQAQTDSEAKIVSSQPISIPDSVIKAGISGKMVFAVSVNETGKVTRAQIIAGPVWPCKDEPREELKAVRKLITDAVLATAFSPRAKDGKPTDAELRLTFAITPARVPNAPAGETNKPRIINAGVVNGKAISLPKPEYPVEARANRLSGTVGIEVVIDEQGNVFSAGSVSGHPVLHETSREAACRARFSPTSLFGKQVKVNGVITYNFIP